MDLALKEQRLKNLGDIVSTIKQIDTDMGLHINIQGLSNILEELKTIDNEVVFMKVYTRTLQTLVGILTEIQTLSSQINKQNLILDEQINTHSEKQNTKESLQANNFIF